MTDAATRPSQPAHISASIMCGDLGSLTEEVARLEQAGVDSIHIDVMDGHFVPNLTFGPGSVRAIRRATRLPLHAHMMVTNPELFVAAFAEEGVDLYFFHAEAEPYPGRLSDVVSRAGMTPGLALNPLTPTAILRGLPMRHVLLMAVEPGFAGQRWIPTTCDRIAEATSVLPGETVIGVDGNVSVQNAVRARAKGASLFVCGSSSLFSGADFSLAVGELRNALAGVGDGARA